METVVLLFHHQHLHQKEIEISTPVNCRTSQSGHGVLSAPFKFVNGSSVMQQGAYGLTKTFSFGASDYTKSINGYVPNGSPVTPVRTPSKGAKDRNQKKSKPRSISKRSSAIPISPAVRHSLSDDLSYAFSEADFFTPARKSELFAGPAYSNSPPPSSLPIPKFSLRVKRSVSLELPLTEPLYSNTHFVKSAPASPTRDPFALNSFCSPDPDSATKDLRRMLQLDPQDN